ncbi:MAG TPA: hypothetical protein VFY93_14545 [Planctomycetota bacterium]|nr:hypothetical protein [Planctomycetota bacterium]
MRRSYLIPFALIAVAAFGQDEAAEEEVASPQIVAFAMSDGSAPSKELESAVGKVRAKYDEKPVLFLTINLSSAAGKNQGAMLFSALGLPQLWETCRKSPGQLVIVDLETVNVLSKHGAKEDLAAALDKHFGKGEGCDEGSGGEDDGCGCGCDDGCGGGK